MNEQLEADLRRVLAAKAARVPSEAIRRITGAAYNPRGRSWRSARRRTVGACAGTGVAGAAVATAVLLMGAAPALAGWTAMPEHGHHVPSVAATRRCRAQLSSLPTAPRGRWSAVVTDVRGPYTLAVFSNKRVYGTCITGPSVAGASVSGVTARATAVSSGHSSPRRHGGNASGQEIATRTSDGRYGSGGIESSAQSSFDSAASGPYTIMEGQVASRVTGVTVQLQDGTKVGTTIGGGWFVAWWPTDEQAISAGVTTPGGTTTVSLVRT